jgi:hypothetical protein
MRHGFMSLMAAGALCLLACASLAQYENEDLLDPRSSEHRSGVDTPRDMFIPPTPPFEKTDMREWRDYKGHQYTPYAQMIVPRTVKINDATLTPGYYLVKLEYTPSDQSKEDKAKKKAQQPDNPNDPQPVFQPSKAPATYPTRGNYPAGSQFPNQVTFPPEPEKKLTRWQKLNPNNSTLAKRIREAKEKYPAVNPKTQSTSDDRNARIALLIKKLGSVEAIIPVVESTSRSKAEKNHIKAQLVIEAADINNPQIVYVSYCAKLTCYKSAPLSPGLVE